LLCREFAHLTSTGMPEALWQTTLMDVCQNLSDICRAVDPQCTDEMLEELAEVN